MFFFKKKQCFDQIFAKAMSSLSKKRHFCQIYDQNFAKAKSS
jgi:hypothetical protein